MDLWQQLIVVLLGSMALVGLLQALYQCKTCNNAFGHIPQYYVIFGSFVWADHLMFGLFWFLASVVVLLLQDFLLFLLLVSVFWLIRSVGETIYWFLQQFIPRRGNDPSHFFWYRVVKNDSVWFLNQIFWQCVTIITLISSVYLFTIWLPRVAF